MLELMFQTELSTVLFDGYHKCWRKLPIVIGYARGDPIIHKMFYPLLLHYKVSIHFT